MLKENQATKRHLSESRSPCLNPIHSDAHTHTHTAAQNTHYLSLSSPHTRTHTHIHTQNTHTLSASQSHTHTRTHTHTLSLSSTHTHIHACTHTHIHLLHITNYNKQINIAIPNLNATMQPGQYQHLFARQLDLSILLPLVDEVVLKAHTQAYNTRQAKPLPRATYHMKQTCMHP